MTRESIIQEISAGVQAVTGGGFDDVAAVFAVHQADEIICGYCNIDEIPEGLRATAVKMAIEILRAGQYENGNDIPMIESSIRIGDTQISRTPVSEKTAGTDPECMSARYAHALNRYRRLQMN